MGNFHVILDQVFQALGLQLWSLFLHLKHFLRYYPKNGLHDSFFYFFYGLDHLHSFLHFCDRHCFCGSFLRMYRNPFHYYLIFCNFHHHSDYFVVYDSHSRGCCRKYIWTGCCHHRFLIVHDLGHCFFKIHFGHSHLWNFLNVIFVSR